ncbi:putative membrane protein [Gemella bergeri ATCC 700627]|uniref:Putative membrane protein n=1 Tax=Gemella bergeri ATCC 700627 TaxID=1321820 RepID=U2QVG7_9BACL|nr:DMT family transporter [Gemella bergeri]ERK60521.1 putative membrane protein [Gemella bergeri ATCC 700627]
MKLSTMQKGTLLTISGATCWGLSGVLGEYLLNVSKIDSIWVITTRLFYAGLILLAIVLIKDKKATLRVFKDKKDVLRLMNFSFFGLLICQGTYFLAIKHTNAGMATVLQFTGPIMIMAFYCVLNKRLPMTREVVAMITSLFGVTLMATHLDFSTLSISAIGLFWGIFSAVGLASYNISSIRLTTKYGATIITAWGLFIAGTVVYFATRSYYIPAGFSLTDFLCITGIVLIGTIASFTMYLEGIKLIGAVTGSIIGCFEPIAAIIFSFLLLGTTFSSLDLLGAAFILSAVVVLSKR